MKESDHTWSTSNRSEESDSESEEPEQEPGRDDTPEILRGRNKENEGQRQQQQIVDILNTQPWEEEFLQNRLNATRDETSATRKLILRPPELEIREESLHLEEFDWDASFSLTPKTPTPRGRQVSQTTAIETPSSNTTTTTKNRTNDTWSPPAYHMGTAPYLTVPQTQSTSQSSQDSDTDEQDGKRIKSGTKQEVQK